MAVVGEALGVLGIAAGGLFGALWNLEKQNSAKVQQELQTVQQQVQDTQQELTQMQQKLEAEAKVRVCTAFCMEILGLTMAHVPQCRPVQYCRATVTVWGIMTMIITPKSLSSSMPYIPCSVHRHGNCVPKDLHRAGKHVS